MADNRYYTYFPTTQFSAASLSHDPTDTTWPSSSADNVSADIWCISYMIIMNTQALETDEHLLKTLKGSHFICWSLGHVVQAADEGTDQESPKLLCSPVFS
ncbi:hypothetical protein ATANTOWER_026272 [Ataeniobius toweri]|uniref:Uncharacterized protein n=1 Tax=Ataeniobius toweri TaxID=208326 RepID=A0ABU7BLP2_9TELE|nr:hypothetical protein [Ataeniobius toweri]